tara:strand:+ start:74 stop:385 length:312 start_codon:yes stop_codon:yes gene_type:complete
MIMVAKLSNGEETIGVFTHLEFDPELEYEIENPVSIGVQVDQQGQGQLAMGPAMPFAEDGETMKLRRQDYIYTYKPRSEVVDQYKKLFGSPILVPEKPNLILG